MFAAVLLLLAAAQPAPATSKRARCAAKGATTLKANQLVKVYARRDSQGNRTLFGCWRKSGRRLKLAKEYDDGLDGRFWLKLMGIAAAFAAGAAIVLFLIGIAWAGFGLLGAFVLIIVAAIVINWFIERRRRL